MDWFGNNLRVQFPWWHIDTYWTAIYPQVPPEPANLVSWYEYMANHPEFIEEYDEICHNTLRL